MGRLTRAYMDAKGFEPAWLGEFSRMNPRVKFSVCQEPRCFPVACRFCRTHFRGRGALRFHWCWWDTARRWGRVDASADADNYRGHFPRVKLHLTDHDCALMLQSTWWEQARAIANKSLLGGSRQFQAKEKIK